MRFTMSGEVNILVRMIARPSFDCFTTFHKLYRDAGSNPVLGSSIYTTWTTTNFNIIDFITRNAKVLKLYDKRKNRN
jgi:hypothetical protein